MPPAWALFQCAAIDALDAPFAVEPGLEGGFAEVVVFVADTGTVINPSRPPPSPPPSLGDATVNLVVSIMRRWKSRRLFKHVIHSEIVCILAPAGTPLPVLENTT